MTDYIEVGQIYQSTDKRRPPRQIRVDSIETWYDPQAGWEADYAVVSESHFLYRRRRKAFWRPFSGKKYLLTDHLTPRHNWRRVK